MEAMSVDNPSTHSSHHGHLDPVVNPIKQELDISDSGQSREILDEVYEKCIEIKPVEEVDTCNGQTLHSDAENISSLSENPECKPVGAVTEVNSAKCENYVMIIPKTKVEKVAIPVKREPEVAADDTQGMVHPATDFGSQSSVDHQFNDGSPDNLIKVKLEEDIVIRKTDTWKIEETESNGCSEESLQSYSAVDSNDDMIKDWAKQMLNPISCGDSGMRSTTVDGAYRDSAKKNLQGNSSAVGYSNKVVMLNLTQRTKPANARRPFECIVCGSSYNNRLHLVKHIKVHKRSRFQMFPCGQCEKVFILKTFLNKHIRLVHKKKVWHVCGVCGHKSWSQASLIVHLREHKAENSQIMIKHFLPSVRKTPEGHPEMIMYPCELCGMMFAAPEYVAKHSKHDHCTCDICGKACEDQKSLFEHNKEHGGEMSRKMPYFCTHCGKRDTNSANLIKHLETHTLTFENPVGESVTSVSLSSYDDSKQEIRNGVMECTARVGSVSQGNGVEGVESPCTVVHETEMCEIKKVVINADFTERGLDIGVMDKQDASASTNYVGDLSSCESDLKTYCMATSRTETGKIKMEEVPTDVGSTERDLELDTGVTDMQVSEGISETDSRELKVEVKTEPSGISFPVHSTEVGLEDHATTGFLEGGKFGAEAKETTADFGHIGEMQLSQWCDAVNYHALVDDPVKCSLCGVTYKNQHSFTQHMKRHQQAALYTCDECGETFPTKVLMVKHKKTFHPREKVKEQFLCEICGRKCQKQSSRDVHREQHEFVSNHVSDGRRYLNFTVFKVPPNGGPKYRKTVYSCNFCQCIYECRGTLQQHLQSKHGINY